MEQEENKYNLRQMLDEIKEDESITPHAARTISQEEIRKKYCANVREPKMTLNKTF